MVSRPDSDAILTYIQQRAGDYFRGFASYNVEETNLLATRDDLNEQMMTDRVEELHRASRTRAKFKAVETLGPPSAIIQLREKAVLVNFPVGDEQGYLLGMEPEAARNLHSFVMECQYLIRQESE